MTVMAVDLGKRKRKKVKIILRRNTTLRKLPSHNRKIKIIRPTPNSYPFNNNKNNNIMPKKLEQLKSISDDWVAQMPKSFENCEVLGFKGDKEAFLSHLGDQDIYNLFKSTHKQCKPGRGPAKLVGMKSH